LLIGRAEDRTYCKIAIIQRLSALDLAARGHLDTAAQFFGLKHDYERYSRQMPLQTNCATFEGRREPRRRVRRMPKPNSRDRCSRGSRLVRVFRPQNCGAVGQALAGTGRVEDDPKFSSFYNGFYLQGHRSTRKAKRAGDCKLARPRRRPTAIAPPRSELFPTNWSSGTLASSSVQCTGDLFACALDEFARATIGGRQAF